MAISFCVRDRKSFVLVRAKPVGTVRGGLYPVIEG